MVGPLTSKHDELMKQNIKFSKLTHKYTQFSNTAIIQSFSGLKHPGDSSKIPAQNRTILCVFSNLPSNSP
jgi:hypothetical protein